MTTDYTGADIILMEELIRRDEKPTVEIFDAVSDPKEMLNVMLKKLHLYNETEAVLKEASNKLNNKGNMPVFKTGESCPILYSNQSYL